MISRNVGQRGVSMRVLVIENYGGTPLGQVGVALREANAELVVVRPFLGDALPSADGFDALIVLGGAQNALDDENHAWFPATLALIRAFESSDRAVLGICLGSQLLARAYQAKNHIGGHYEFGWHTIELTEAAGDDPVFRSLPARFPIFEWHDDHFNLPQGAVQLASSAIAPNQAFRIGRAAYGTQFHFEADRKLAAEWSEIYADLLAERQPDWRESRMAEQAALHGETADAAGLAIARAWVALI